MTLNMATDLIYKNMNEHVRHHKLVQNIHSALLVNVSLLTCVLFSLDLDLNKKSCLLFVHLLLLVQLVLCTFLFYDIEIIFTVTQREMNSTVFEQLKPIFQSYDISVRNK